MTTADSEAFRPFPSVCTPEGHITWSRAQIGRLKAWTPEEAETSAEKCHQILQRGYQERMELWGNKPGWHELNPPPVRLSGEEHQKAEINRLYEIVVHWTHRKVPCR